MPSAASVAAWLRAHPGFLAEHTDLYSLLAPPRRVHGEVLADHMEARFAAERARCEAVLAAARADSGMALRVEAAVLALLAAPDPLACIAEEFPALLGIDAAHFSAEAPAAALALFGTQEVWIGPSLPEVAGLHGAAAALARQQALLRIPPPRPGGVAGVLALAARDAEALPAAGARALGFLGRAVAALLRP